MTILNSMRAAQEKLKGKVPRPSKGGLVFNFAFLGVLAVVAWWVWGLFR